jgi:hypothetical protein
MKRFILFTLTLFSLMIFAASTLHAGYRLDPWGSKTWTGPERPPHWSPEPAPQRTKPTKHVKSRDFREPVGLDRGVRIPQRPGGKGVFWKDKNNRWHNHPFRRFDSIYYQVPRFEEVIIEREKRIPVYIQIQRKPAKLQCAGETITSNDPKTGELIIEYVTGARDC